MRRTKLHPCHYSAARSSVVRLLGFAAAVLLLPAAPLVQADVSWNVASGDWSSAGNWSGAAVPTSSDNADIYNGGTATVTQIGEVCNNLSLGGMGGGTLQVTGGSLSISSSALVGLSGSGGFVQSGGAVSLSNASSGAIYFGYNSGDVGTGNFSGGLLTASNEWIGYQGAANFTQTGGTNSAPNQLVLGWNTASPVSYSLSNSGVLSAGNEWVGVSGSANFTQSGGTHTVASTLFVDSATYSLSAGLFSVGVQEYVGLSQSGTFTQTGGTNSVAGGLDLGESGGAGNYTVSGPGLLTTATEVVGYSGTGTFTQTAGTNSTGTLSLAYSAGSSGTYNLTGGKLIASQITQGAGAAQVNFSGGTLQAGGTFSSSVPMTLGGEGGGGGGATVATGGYTMTFSGSLSGPGGLTKTDAGALVLAASNIYSGGTTLDAGALVAANGSDGSATGSGSVTLNGGTLASAAGGGSIQGNVQAGSGDCVIAPGGVGTIGPLSRRQLDHRLEHDAQLRFDHSGRQRRPVDD